MKRDSSSPQAYRNDVDGKQRHLLERLRELIFEACPDVEEGIEYGMLDYPGLANMAAQKNYVSLYVLPSVLAQFKDEFKRVNSGKSCLRFRSLEQVDPDAVRRLLRAVRKAKARRS